jgi:hypothetical protein
MKRATNIVGVGLAALWLALGLAASGCQDEGMTTPVAGTQPPAPAAPDCPAAEPCCMTLYVKVVVDKKYGQFAHLVGGMRDSTWRRTVYDPANPWWRNPLVAFADPPFRGADVVGGADAEAFSGDGATDNVALRTTLVPHIDVAVKTIPRSDGIRGSLTTTISSLAEFYDGHWAEMVRQDDRKITFNFDTCDPLQHTEVISRETRTIPAFAFERYTRKQTKWEPKSAWPQQPKSGDWHVVIYGKEATLEVTSYRYVQQSVRSAQQ